MDKQSTNPSAQKESAPIRRELGTASGDFVAPEDFDAPLPEDVLAEFER